MKRKISSYEIQEILDNVPNASNEEIAEDIEFLTESILKTQKKLALAKFISTLTYAVSLAGLALIPVAMTPAFKMLGAVMLGGGFAGYLVNDKTLKLHEKDLKAFGYLTTCLMKELKDRVVGKTNIVDESTVIFADIFDNEATQE